MYTAQVTPKLLAIEKSPEERAKADLWSPDAAGSILVEFLERCEYFRFWNQYHTCLDRTPTLPARAAEAVNLSARDWIKEPSGMPLLRCRRSDSISATSSCVNRKPGPPVLGIGGRPIPATPPRSYNATTPRVLQ
jgi:hypothetical protein